jgi:hypothetical protein
MLLRAKSVHGFGMDHPLAVVGLDADLTVVASTVLQPRRVVRIREAVWILEVAPSNPLPPTGARLRRMPESCT